MSLGLFLIELVTDQQTERQTGYYCICSKQENLLFSIGDCTFVIKSYKDT